MSSTAKRASPVAPAGSRNAKSSAATASESDESPAAVFQAARVISQIAWPVEGAEQALQEPPVCERTCAPLKASDAARPLPEAKTWTAALSMSE